MMMTKRIVLSILFSLYMSSINLIYSQFYKNNWINGNVGLGYQLNHINQSNMHSKTF